ncbi:hypothetical protein [Actinomadura chibensis]|nr:hypothetical protein [Actinomadura chibensis]
MRLRDDAVVNAVVARWARAEPAFAGLSSVALLEEAKSGPVDERVDALLGALAHKAGSPIADAPIAARIALQMMLPKAVRISRAHARLLPDADERDQLAVCCMYTAIRTLPARITHHVPPYLAWGAHQAMRREVLAQVRELPSDAVEAVAVPRAERNASEELGQLLAWAVARSVISRQDADLLAARYGNEAVGRRHSWKNIGDLQQIAEETGLSPAAIKQRCSRATRKLAAAVADYQPGPARGAELVPA